MTNIANCHQKRSFKAAEVIHAMQCGHFAIANMIEICFGYNPEDVSYMW